MPTTRKIIFRRLTFPTYNCHTCGTYATCQECFGGQILRRTKIPKEEMGILYSESDVSSWCVLFIDRALDSMTLAISPINTGKRAAPAVIHCCNKLFLFSMRIHYLIDYDYPFPYGRIQCLTLAIDCLSILSDQLYNNFTCFLSVGS